MSEQLPSANQHNESQADADFAAYAEELRAKKQREFQESLFGDAPLGERPEDYKRVEEALEY